MSDRLRHGLDFALKAGTVLVGIAIAYATLKSEQTGMSRRLEKLEQRGTEDHDRIIRIDERVGEILRTLREK